ncbi:unnamed protein product [Staurois parvus]|uniref:Uncharacterized protein n=1 Tax=Staurois parvus TaxID=386267 RepID=A0ABN9DTH4_9NEOB|nr:unnamed protein product [Staurois parvus]
MIDGTDWHHCWALTGGTDWHNRWALTGSTAGLHWWVALVGGTGGCIAGHRWVHCWAQVGGTCGWHCWAPIIRALIISALMIVPILALTTAGSRQYFPHDLTA